MPIGELVLQFEQSERRIEIAADCSYGIGRGSHNAVYIPSNRVSRDHAIVKQDEGGRFCVFDLGSRNGTFLNNRLLSGSGQLSSGDVITVGDASIRFVLRREYEAPTLSPGLSTSTMVATDIALVTVLVLDIRDFTTLTFELGPARTAQMIRQFNQSAGELLDSSHAWSKKFIGDAVMAVWVNDTAEARFSNILTAFRVADTVRTAAGRLHDMFELPAPVCIGCGINAGLASIGNVGGGSTADCTALGDTVNRTFRLEASTRKLKCDVVFGDAVYEVLNTRIAVEEFASRHRIIMKGYSEESDVYSMDASAVSRLLAALDTENGVLK